MLVNSNNSIITAPNIILERTSNRMGNFIDAADDSNNIKGNNILLQALRVFDNIMEANGVYPYIKAFFPTIGGTSFSHKFNFMNPAQYVINWPSQYIHSLSGIKHDNTSIGAASSSLLFSDLVKNDTHLLFAELELHSTLAVSTGFYDTSSLPNSLVNRFLMHTRYTDGNHYSDHYSGTNNRMQYVNDSSLGIYFTQRTSINYAETRKNGVIKSINTNASDGNPVGNLYIGGVPSLVDFYKGLFSCIGVGYSMPNAQVTAYYQAVSLLLKICGKI